MKKEELIKKRNVVLIRSGKKEIAGSVTDRDAIRVGVTKKVPMGLLKPEDRIPKKVDGMETDVFETEMPVAFRTSKHRPAPGGVSIGHPEVTAGTLGMVVNKNGSPYILSNKHVLAPDGASMGDQSWQPGKADGGKPSDSVGHLSEWVPTHFEDDESICPIAHIIVTILNFFARLLHRQTRLYPKSLEMNKVDCAITRPLFDGNVSDEILEIGKPVGFAEANVNDAVKKSGRTSAVTKGVVENTDGIARVSYGGGRTAVFMDQLITSPIASPGDSGSVVLNEKKEVVGLLFAGSDSLTLVNKIQNVIEALGLEKTL